MRLTGQTEPGGFVLLRLDDRDGPPVEERASDIDAGMAKIRERLKLDEDHVFTVTWRF